MRLRSTAWLLVLSLLGAVACGKKDASVSLKPVDSSSPYFAYLFPVEDPPGGSSSVPAGTQFDSNGAIVSQNDGTTSAVYTYDTNGRLTSQKVTVSGASVEVRAVYDADGNKLVSYGEHTTYTFVNSQVRVVSRDGGSPQTLLQYEDTETDESGNPNYFLKDHLGSVVAVAQADGNILEAKDTLPFGQDLYSFSATAHPVDYGFNGNRKEGVLSFNRPLIDYNARHLQAMEGRFLQADTVIPDAGSLLSYNRYIYTRNNPVNRIDPTGHADGPNPHMSAVPTFDAEWRARTIRNLSATLWTAFDFVFGLLPQPFYSKYGEDDGLHVEPNPAFVFEMAALCVGSNVAELEVVPGRSPARASARAGRVLSNAGAAEARIRTARINAFRQLENAAPRLEAAVADLPGVQVQQRIKAGTKILKTWAAEGHTNLPDDMAGLRVLVRDKSEYLGVVRKIMDEFGTPELIKDKHLNEGLYRGLNLKYPGSLEIQVHTRHGQVISEIEKPVYERLRYGVSAR